MIHADLLGLLRCPQSRQKLGVAGPEVLATVNERMAQDPRGPAIDPPLTEALLRLDGRVLYPVRDGIPVLLADESIRL